MKNRRYNKLRSQLKNKFRLNYHSLNSTNDKSFAKELLVAIKDVILVVAGGVIGILGNQWFFEPNKRLEAKIELEREFFQDQLPYLTRIINFTYSYNVITKTIYTNPEYTTFSGIDNNGKAYFGDTIATRWKDSVLIIMPDIAIDTNKRKEFFNDIEEINKHKDKIDINVWYSFRSFVNFIEANPFPEKQTDQELAKSKWNTKELYVAFDSLHSELFNVAMDKMNNPYKNNYNKALE